MTRLFGIAGVQMSVVPWDASATVDKMADITKNIHKSFPWVQLMMFHELVVPGLVQFVTADNGDTWKKNAEPIPGPLTERLCELARQVGHLAGSRLDVRTGRRQTLQHGHRHLAAGRDWWPNIAKCSPGCPTRAGPLRATSSAYSTSRRRALWTVHLL